MPETDLSLYGIEPLPHDCRRPIRESRPTSCMRAPWLAADEISNASEEDAGGFMIVDPLTSAVLAGGSPQAFSMTLDEVKDYSAARPKTNAGMIPEADI